MRLANQVVLIMGATRDIGKSVAFAAAEAGASVAIADADAVRGTDIQGHLESSGRTAIYCECDNRTEESIQAAIGDAVLHYGNLTSVIVCVDPPAAGDALTLTVEDYDRSVADAVRSAWLAARYAMPFLKQAPHGGIVFVAPTGAPDRAMPASLAHAALASGIAALTRSLAGDFGRFGIRVNAVLADAIETSDWRKEIQSAGGAGAERLARAAQTVPLGRLGRTDEAARVALFLLSEGASFVNGAVIPVDGGKHAQASATFKP